MNDIPVQLYDKDGNPAYPRPYYRIGDFLESTNPNNPGDDGYIGTWELYGKGRVTVCIDINDNDFNTVGKTSGEKEVTLTTDMIPSHAHGIPQAHPYNGSAESHDTLVRQSFDKSTEYNVDSATVGGGQAHNNMPPYIVIYRWRRIA